MQKANKTLLGVSEIYYTARLLAKETNISSQLNFRPYLKILGCEIIESSNFFSKTEKDIDVEQHYFMKIEGPQKFCLIIPEDCNVELERILLAQGLGHFILHSQSGLIPCVIPTLHSSEVSTEGFWFALFLLIEKNSFLKAIQNNLGIIELCNLFRVPEVAVISNMKIVKHLKDIL